MPAEELRVVTVASGGQSCKDSLLTCACSSLPTHDPELTWKSETGTYLAEPMLSLYKALGSVPSITTESCCLRMLFTPTALPVV